MCLEAPDNLPARANDVHVAICASDEEAVGTRADAGYGVALKKGACLVIGGEFDLANVEEVKRLPLSGACDQYHVVVYQISSYIPRETLSPVFISNR